ncbi:hypothetical protein HZ326_4164 [Fusarium oxysporum f. sp. albedinis]|nr:hypothetical protein HZ326_4164 [Fusarium oxysporum f. sp. albedinis]
MGSVEIRETSICGATWPEHARLLLQNDRDGLLDLDLGSLYKTICASRKSSIQQVTATIDYLPESWVHGPQAQSTALGSESAVGY